MHGGGAVLETMRAAGILRYIAADAGGGLARGIGGKEVPAISNSLSQSDVNQPGLHDGALVRQIDLQDAVHPVEPDHDAALQRKGPAREPGPGPTRDDGKLFAIAH